MNKFEIISKNNKTIRPYQKEALERMTKLFLEEERPISSILSLPTGAGKTFTALKFASECYKNGYKIIVAVPQIQILKQFSGAIEKGDITQDDLNVSSLEILEIYNGGDSIKEVTQSTDMIFSTYQSLVNRMDDLKRFIKRNKILLIIDEAHHAATKSHQIIINKLREFNANALILGLTATPYRTSEQETGLLSKTFTDGCDKKGNAVFGDIGIVYKIDKQELIHLGYLARPIFKSVPTAYLVDDDLTTRELSNLYQNGNLPEKIVEKLSKDVNRNKLIVDTYMKNKDVYGQTIIFCDSRIQVYALKKLFESQGVKVGLAISSEGCVIQDLALTKEAVNDYIEDYRNGKISVLLTCQMLDEGFDVPNTKSIFLTMQTTSQRRLDQRIGRGMRYKEDDNTFNVVSFEDKWGTDIDWVTPESLFPKDGEVGSLIEGKASELMEVEKCSLSNFSELMNIIDNIYANVSTDEILSKLDSIKPVGFYFFDIPSQFKTCTVTVLSNAKEIFDKFVVEVEGFLSTKDFTGDFVMDELVSVLYNNYFASVANNIITLENVRDFLSYYIEYGMFPEYRDFDSDFLDEVDAQKYASHIIKEDMRKSEEAAYLDESYNNSVLLQRYFLKKENFISMVTKVVNAMCK